MQAGQPPKRRNLKLTVFIGLWHFANKARGGPVRRSRGMFVGRLSLAKCLLYSGRSTWFPSRLSIGWAVSGTQQTLHHIKSGHGQYRQAGQFLASAAACDIIERRNDAAHQRRRTTTTGFPVEHQKDHR